jgi:hypothetical protein
MNKRQVLKRLANPKRRDRILDDFNRDNTPDTKPLRGDQAVKVLKEMNELEAGHDEFVKSLDLWKDFL